MPGSRSLPAESIGRTAVRGGIASTSRGISARFVVGLGATGNAKSSGRKQAMAARKLKSDYRMARVAPTFNEIAERADLLELGVGDRSREDEVISHEEGKCVAAANFHRGQGQPRTTSKM